MDTQELFCLLKKEAEYFSVDDIIKRAAADSQSPGSLEQLSPLSKYDLEALMEIKTRDCLETIEDVDTLKLKNFVFRIDRYMEENAPDQPDLARYVRLVSIYLAFIAKKPLHPPGMVLSDGRPIVNKHGKYFCPLKKRQLHEPLSLCQYCVSRESGAIGNEWKGERGDGRLRGTNKKVRSLGLP
jgi:uncharacterized protein (UPF0305 family)